MTIRGQILVSRTDDDPPAPRRSIQNASVCTFKTSPCVPAPRAHVSTHCELGPCQAAPHTDNTQHTPQHTPHATDTTDTTQGSNRCRLSVVAVMFAPSVGAMSNGAHAFATSDGTAWRPRQRRLRAFRRYVLWHSKMEVAAALHHTAPRVVGSLPPVAEFAGPVYGQVHLEQFSAGETTENTAKIPVVQEQVLVQAIPRFVGSLPAVDDFTAYVARRPLPLVEVRPSVRVQRHFVEDLGELALLVQILDLPVPQPVDYVTDVLRLLDRPLAKQAISVPKISCSPCPSRS